MKKIIAILSLCLFAAILSYAAWKFVFPHDKAIDLDRIESLISDGTIEATLDGERVSFIDGNFTSQTVADSADAASVLNSASALFGDSFHADAEDFISQPYDDGAFRANYYRYCPSINGVPVLGSQIILSADRDANVTALFSSYVPEIEKVDTAATITADEASGIAITELLNSDPMRDFLNSLTDETIPRDEAADAIKSILNVASDLIIYAVDHLESPRLVYAVSVDNILDAESIEGDYEVIDPDENPDIVVMPTVSNTYYIAANGEDAGQTMYSVNNIKSFVVLPNSSRDITHDFSVKYLSDPDKTKILKDVGIQEHSTFDDNELVSNKYKYYSLYDGKRNIVTRQAYRIPLFGGYTYGAVSGTITASHFDKFPDNALWAHYNIAQAYEFYKKIGRISYDGNEAQINVVVGYNSEDMENNAAWNPTIKRILFGTGGYEAALDVVGHEFTHAVFGSIVTPTSKIEPQPAPAPSMPSLESAPKPVPESVTPSPQPAPELVVPSTQPTALVEFKALDESYADIIGSLIENKPADDEGRWLLGEDSAITVRNLKSPESKNQPDTYTDIGTSKWKTRAEKDEHTYCGIFNKASYLMMTNECTKTISNEKWGQLFYRSMYALPYGASFLDAKVAIIQTAKMLFESEQIQAIKDAFDTVEIKNLPQNALVLKGQIFVEGKDKSVPDASVKVIRYSDNIEIQSYTNQIGGFSVWGIPGIDTTQNNSAVMDAFWKNYYVQIEAPKYQTLTITSHDDERLVSASIDANVLSVYDLGIVDLSPAIAKIDVSSLPEIDALERFLADFDFSFGYDADEYDFTDESVHERVNILDRVMGSYFLGNEPYEWMEITPIDPDSVQISSQWMYSGRYKSEDVDWLLRNIFNCSDDAIQKMREASGTNPDGHNYYYNDGSYYRPDSWIGGSVYPFIVSAKYDGEFYYLIYDAFDEIDFPDSYEGRRYAVLKLKNIDGNNYWSVYQWYKSAPEEPENISGDHYLRTANADFEKGLYEEAETILRTGYEYTGDSSLQTRLADMLAQYIPVSSLPDFDELYSLLSDSCRIFEDWTHEFNADRPQMHFRRTFPDGEISDENLLDLMGYLLNFFFASLLEPTEEDADVNIPFEQNFYRVYSADSVDKILKNIFNLSDSTIQQLKDESRNDPDAHSYYYQNNKYYLPFGDDTFGGINVEIVAAKYDGTFYYIVYDAAWEYDFFADLGLHYSVVSRKKIDGQDCWSLHRWCDFVPDEYDMKQPDIEIYTDWADRYFFRGQYTDTLTVLQDIYDNTGNTFVQNRLKGLRAFPQKYETDDAYLFDIPGPQSVENLMGLPGFYVYSRPGGFYQQDFYACYPDGTIIQVGEVGSSVGLSGQDEYEGFFIRDVDGDGVTELICHGSGTSSVTVYVYRMKDGVIEESSLGPEDLNRLSPPDRQEGGRRDGSSWYDDETGMFYLEYSTRFEPGYGTEYSYLQYHDLSPFVFHQFNVGAD